jgi:hypothetical protein
MRRGKRVEIVEFPYEDPETEVIQIGEKGTAVPWLTPVPYEPAIPVPYEPAVPEPKGPKPEEKP